MSKLKKIGLSKTLFLLGLVGLIYSCIKLEGGYWIGAAVFFSSLAILFGLDGVCKYWVRKAKGLSDE